MTDVLVQLAPWPMMEILFIAAVLLVLVDYFFPVDYPAFLGYLCFAGGLFFGLPLGALPSLAVAVVAWLLLLLLHRIWFRRFLTNAGSG